MSQDDPKKNLIRGAVWTVGTRWVIKALGFINTIIMARLLMPEDYGIVAMGMLVVGMIQTFLDFGATIALLRKDTVSRDEIDSAWTLRLMQGIAAGVVLFLIPPLAIAYFHEPRLQYVLLAFAASILLASASNIGPTLAQKEFNFALGFKIETTAKLASVAVTLVCGFLLGDYRALMFGIVAGFLTPLVLSYAWHPYRPRWNTAKIGEIWGVTKWLLLANIGNFVLRKGDEVAAGRIGTTHEYGLYNVGADFGALPVGEVGPAMLRALLPVLSSIQEDVKRTNYAVIKTTAAINTVIWPIGLGFAAIALPATELVLGAKWADAVPYVSAFSLIAILLTATSPARTLLTLRGHTRIQNTLVWLEFVVFICAALLLVPQLHLLGLAVARLAGGTVNLLTTLAAAKKYCDLPFTRTLNQILRPMLGAFAMGLLANYLMSFVSGTLPQIAVGVMSGALFFAVWSLVSWKLVGEPEGLESTVMDRLFPNRHIRGKA